MSEREALYRAICQHPHDDTPRLVFADHLEESDEPLQSEFIRVQCELARLRSIAPRLYWQYIKLHEKLTLVDRHKTPEGLRFHEDIAAPCTRLASRERELFIAHAREWFGAGSLIITPPQPTVPCRLIRRGFPSHWYGPWREWVGGECQNCDGDGLSTGPPESRPCRSCKGSGRIPGACHRAWKPSWTMKCGRCQGLGRIEKNGSDHRCPECFGECRVSMPMPPDALPITDVTLTTVPELRYGRDAAGNAIAVLPVGRVEHSAEYVGKPTSEVVRELLAAEWPGITFHLPQGVM